MDFLILFLLVAGMVLALVRAFGIHLGRVNLGWVAVALGFLLWILQGAGV